ncbi:hypothetical protein BC943DRAFT_321337 [Umbelopsis sp. AD052]|nr:hypothetical protein BC943DRAFT_321337 [Umbelopsis sp. AD052]
MPKSKAKKLANKEKNALKTQEEHVNETDNGQKKRFDQNRGKEKVKQNAPASKDRESKPKKVVHDTFFAAPETSHGKDNDKKEKKQHRKPYTVNNAKADFKGRTKPYSKPVTKDRPSKPTKQKHDTLFTPPSNGADGDRKKKMNAGKPSKGQQRKASISKPTKQKHDTFFAPPPEPTDEDGEDEEEEHDKVEAEEPPITEKEPDVDSMAVIETIKIPEPGETILDAKSNIAARSGVVSVVDKTNKKRKRSKIDVVAELENDAKKMVKAGDNLGAGLEVDGWD